MLKNIKGFTLLEMLIVILILGILAGVGIPHYQNSVNKARVSTNMPLMRALQVDITNFFALNNALPDKLWQLSVDRREFIVSSNTEGVHRATNCTISLYKDKDGYPRVLEEDCGRGWVLQYPIKRASLGYMPAQRTFKITGNNTANTAVAKNFAWRKINDTTYEII